MTKISYLTIYNFFKRTEKIKNYPSKEDCKQILFYIEQDNYLQIIYDYGNVYLLILLNMFEKREDYEICKDILVTIKNRRKVSGEDLKTRL